MQSIKIPPDAATRAAYRPFLAAGAQPGESVVLDDDGAVAVVRYPSDRQAERLAAALREVQGGAAIMMFGEHEGEGEVFVPGDAIDAEDQLAIDRAIEQSEIQYNEEGGAA